jgi:hypothetical protein
MEALCSSETSVATQRTTRSQIPEDDTLHNHRRENLKSYMYSHFDVLYVSRTFRTSTAVGYRLCALPHIIRFTIRYFHVHCIKNE